MAAGHVPRQSARRGSCSGTADSSARDQGWLLLPQSGLLAAPLARPAYPRYQPGYRATTILPDPKANEA